MNLRFIMSRTIQFYQKNGIIKTLKKVISKIPFSKQKREEKEENQNYKLWIQNNEPSEIELETQRKHKFDYTPKISVIVPMYNTKEKYLKELIASLLQQTYSNWELCLADGSKEKQEYVQKLVSEDERIKYKFLNANKGISENSNEALKLASGEYIVFLDGDDYLAEMMIFYLFFLYMKL